MGNYIGVEPVTRASRVLTEGVLTSSTQTISVPAGFTPDNIFVYINGSRLAQGDYDDSDGSVVDLGEAVPAGTEYVIEEVRSFALAGHYTKAESDARYHADGTDITHSGRLEIEADVGSAPNYTSGQVRINCNDSGDVSVGFHRVGATACQLRHESNGLILSGNTPTASADFVATGNITANSDLRLKANIEVIPRALDKVGQLSGYTFDRKDEDIPRQTGVIAQEVLEVLPEAVIGGPTEDNPDNPYSVAYGNMVGLLIESIKELKTINDDLSKRISVLENK